MKTQGKGRQKEEPLRCRGGREK